MKLAFSTLGCPGWSWNDIFATAKDLGLQGIEIRGIANEMFAPRIGVFQPGQVDETLARLAKARMELPMLTSNACLGYPGKLEGVEEARAYIDLAARLGAPYVRVMITPVPTPEEADLAQAKRLYGELCAYGAQRSVIPLIETNGLLADSAVMKEFMVGCNPVQAGVLWDIHHPYRFFGEAPETTLANIGPWVKYTHVKDSVMKDGTVSYRMMGYGDLPVMDALKLLHEMGYEGYVTLEWLKRWCPDLQEPGIVFSHFTNYMSYLLKQL